MIKKACDIMIKDFMFVNQIDSISLINNIALDKGIKYFPVINAGNIVGVITNEELKNTSPEKLVADVMRGIFSYVNAEASIDQVREIFEKEDYDFLLVENNSKTEGLIERTILNSTF